MASSVEVACYLEGSGVPVGWKDGAVAFREVTAWMCPFVPLSLIAMGAIVYVDYFVMFR
jgi:hypothetical protein